MLIPNHDPVLLKMRAAHVPTTVYDLSLQKLRQTKLVEDISDRAFEKGVAGLINYKISSEKKTTPTAFRVAATLAKTLLLLSPPVPVYCALVLELVNAHKGIDAETDSVWYDPIRLGKGYLVVADFHIEQSTVSPGDFKRIQETLCTHVSRGGGLIIGEPRCDYLPSFEFNDILLRAEAITVS